MEDFSDKNGIPAETNSDNGCWKISTRHQNRLAAVQFLFAWQMNHDWAAPVNQDELGDELNRFFSPINVSLDEQAQGVPARAFYSPAASIACECNCEVPVEGRGRNFYAFAEQLSVGVLENHEMIDEKISAYLKNWTFERVDKVALTILRVAVYELTMRHDIPPIVTINEALNLVKELSDVDTKRFVNGILDQICKTLSRPLR